MSIAAISLERRHRFSVAEFERMGEAGVVASDARFLQPACEENSQGRWQAQ